MKEAKDKGIDFHDLGSVQQFQTRSQVHLAQWAIHLWSPTSVPADALRRTKEKCGSATVISSERCVMSETLGSSCSLACASCVNRARWKPCRLGKKTTTLLSEEGEHSAWNLSLDAVAPDSPGTLVESFPEDEELARTALSCHHSLDFFCQEVHAAW